MFYYQGNIFRKPTVQTGEKSIGCVSASQNENFHTLVLDVNGVKAIPVYLRAEVFS